VSGPEPAAEPTGAQRVMAQLGGVSGLVYSSLPVVVFVAASELWGLPPAIGTALGMAALLLVWQLIRRSSTLPAVSGFVGVLVCALIAYVLGESKGYFLLGIWMSLVWAAVFALSVLIRRPVVGYLWSRVSGHDRGWRDVRRAVYAFDVATLTWVLVFGSRFVVQGLLYQADRTGWLGVARITMGWPLTAGAAVVTYLAIKAAQRAVRSGRRASPSGDRKCGDGGRWGYRPLGGTGRRASPSGPVGAADAAPPPPQ
jgi:hypothetical protein